MGVAVSALPWAASAAGIGREASVDAVPLYKVVYDTRFAAGVEFARRASARGLLVHAIDGDMTHFWYDDLYHRWRHGPAAIAGLTAHGALFCLEQLAWDHRMRVVFRSEHSVNDKGSVAHGFEGPAALVTAAVEATSSSAWPVAMADVIGQCPRGRPERATASAVTAASTPPSAEPLFSWVIAPLARG